MPAAKNGSDLDAQSRELKGRYRRQLFEAMERHMKQQERDQAGPQQRVAANARLAQPSGPLRVGIVGGGMSGMYTALLLEHLGIGYHLFEASGERMGGRVKTHYFNDGPHQYAEMGAMRFPHTWMQTRLFNFWDYLNKTSGEVPGARTIPRIPYVLYDHSTAADAGNLLCFNGRRPATRNAVAEDNSLLGFDDFFKSDEYAYFKDSQGRLKPAQSLLTAALAPFMELLEAGEIDAAWDRMLRFDAYSGRSYLQEIGDGKHPYPATIVDYMETVLSYTGVYDLAFTEMLLDNFSFEEKTWSAMEGGTDRVTQEMVKRIPAERVQMGARISRVEERGGRTVLHYQRGDGALPQQAEFDHVVMTLPFSALRFVDTPASWSPAKYDAIRTLKMTNAVKIALGFKTRFWESAGPHSAHMAGGQSNTDLPVRSVVYPSFGIGEPGPAYLLASYCWQNDADKFAHLTEQQMFDACLRHLVTLHGEVAREQYLGHGAAVAWNQEPLAGGGFEFFGPGQFTRKFLAAREPQGGVHFAGEHLDMVHYWIAGAYDSAFRCVWEVLVQEGLMDRAMMIRLRDALGGGLILPTMIPYFGDTGLEALARDVFFDQAQA